ncbi:MAG: phosphatase PAP2 family protein [Acidobacteriia bacterium]|nr:phosphatase PAP2 family protein [Terriglobia bacterium]
MAIALLLACAAMFSPAQEQDPPNAKRACTDLSGSVTLPCPGGAKSPTMEDMDKTEADNAPSAAAAPRHAPSESRPNPNPAAPTAHANAAQPPSPVRPASIRQPIGSAYPDADPGSASVYSTSAAVGPEPVSLQPASSVPGSPERALFRNLVADQKAIWTSPVHLHLNDVQWLAPLLGGSAIMIASDTDIERHVPTGANFRKQSNSLSNYGVAAFAGVTGATWLWGVASHNDHMRETGVLSGEAALDSFALTYAIKSLTQRDRPYEGNGHGNFWSKGNSFPSEHAAAAWSVATVFAHEYPGPLTKLFAYGGAAAISAARVTADKHFASDALVGSAIGYFVGRQVYRAHHSGENPDRIYGTFERARGAEGPRDPANMGSTYVSLDSWVYAAMDRLAALGYIQSAFAGLRPWTRMECARLLDEASMRINSDTGGGKSSAEAARLYQALQSEFSAESRRLGGGRNLSAELESIYTRFTGISGKPLNDSYHFGQTIINDYGRPYQEGFNMVTGFTSHAEAGPLAFYVHGEYQHAPSAPAYPLAVRQAIATKDANPVQPAIPVAAHDDFQLLDTYVALNIRNNQISFGRQSTWWGPGQGGALMFSDNALPFYSLRWMQVSPFKLPSLLGFLGPVRTDMFIGRLEGHHYPGNPYISGQKLSFKPTENLEVGFSKISIFAGGGHPLSWHNFYKSTFGVNNHPSSDTFKFDVGDHRGGFDFTYRIPGLRNWLTLYSDSLVDDDPSPIAAPRRAAVNPGIYLSHVPGVPKLDFRAEAVNTDPPSGRSLNGQFIYWNLVYHDSHTNAGNLMGSWIGREGRGVQASSTYWFSAQNTFTLSYRNGRVSKDFVPGGGSLDDYSARTNWVLRPDLKLSGWIQYERWSFPFLAPRGQSNVTTSIQLTFRPAAHLSR